MIGSDIQESETRVQQSDISSLHFEMIHQLEQGIKGGLQQKRRSIRVNGGLIQEESLADFDEEAGIKHHTIFVPYCPGEKKSALYNEAYSYLAQQLGSYATMKEIHQEQKLGPFL